MMKTVLICPHCGAMFPLPKDEPTNFSCYCLMCYKDFEAGKNHQRMDVRVFIHLAEAWEKGFGS